MMNYHSLFIQLCLLLALVARYEQVEQNQESTKNLLIDLLNFRPSFQLPFLPLAENSRSKVCELCKTVTNAIVLAIKMGIPKDLLGFIAVESCKLLNMASERECKGYANLNKDILAYIVENAKDPAERLCNSVPQNFGCFDDKVFNWSIKLPEGNSMERPKLDEPSRHSINILQLSDIHYDPEYTPGNNAKCGELLCCQKDQGKPSELKNACGYWTDYKNADVPWHLVAETVRQAKSHDFQYVYFTGDIVSHRNWNTSEKSNRDAMNRVYQYFKDNFKVGVFPILGNHEPHPVNVWTSQGVKEEKFDQTWIFKLVAEEWSSWLGTNVTNTLLRGGYYTVSPAPGFRIVGLNGNVCYTFNWWIVYDDVDPFGQLQWLVEVLTDAEKNNESVHILTHIFSGHPYCLRVYGREYRRIVERFANTITGQFNGHSHVDEFQVYYKQLSENGTKVEPLGVAFNGASVTPFEDSNPSYKIYTIDADVYTVLDFEEWTFNLTLANQQGANSNPQWYKLYNFKETYGVEDLQRKEICNLLHRMTRQHELIDKYYRYKFRNSDPTVGSNCNATCHKEILCEITTSQFGDTSHCEYFKKLYDQ